LASVPDPDVAHQLHALNNIARVLEGARRFDEAESYLLQSLKIDQDQPAVLQHYVHLRQKQCKWPVYQPLQQINLVLGLVIRISLPMQKFGNLV
jgi:predicted O-linked N-acetylglucosamine transferase (SPINDLY family)